MIQLKWNFSYPREHNVETMTHFKRGASLFTVEQLCAIRNELCPNCDSAPVNTMAQFLIQNCSETIPTISEFQFIA
jgi:hypothetical protein